MSLGTNPAFAQTGIVTIAATTASAGAALPPGGDTVLVTNASTGTAWVALGAGATPPVAAVGAGYPVLAGSRRAIASSSLISQVAAVLSTGTGSVIVETGTGSAT